MIIYLQTILDSLILFLFFVVYFDIAYCSLIDVVYLAAVYLCGRLYQQ